jgi:glycosyltransferase involved in cell wall biosynthesis
MRVLVMTVVHHPQDARIYFREISALLSHGHQVSYAAAFDSFPISQLDSRIETITIPRASGKNRIRALLAVRKLLRTRSIDFDLVLIHDPELLLVASSSKTPVVWDVHEDTAAAISAKAWLPALFKRPAARFIKKLELRAEQQHHLLLAEAEYQFRFMKPHPIIPNTTLVPDYVGAAPTKSVVYLGNITTLRGGQTLLSVGKKLKPHGISLELIGGCPETELAAQLNQAVSAGDLIWHGFVPNETAKQLLPGKLAGLSLLQNHPNYQVSQPTKIYEYLAAGIPVISTALPHAKKLINAAGAGVIVDFDNAAQVVAEILNLANDSVAWRRFSESGHRYVQQNHNWSVDQEKFVSALEDFAAK